MIRPIPIGIDDFRVLREKQFAYIATTHLITEFLDRENIKVILLPRPRRFGKTLNMSTLKWFFEKRDENVWHIFEGLHVAQAGENYRTHFQKYPVIFISLKETKATTFDECVTRAKANIRGMYELHRDALEGNLAVYEVKEFQAILNDTADLAIYSLSLKRLTELLHKAYGVRPIILIDEYDAGIHAAHTNGFYKEAIGFFGGFFLAGLKDNLHLERAVMTGILRVSQESIFSDLNSIGVYTLLDPEFNTCFGFTEPEVQALLEKAGMPELLQPVRSYYDGYEFGGVEIYNPWSILSFFARGSRQLMPHWVGTSSSVLIQEQLQHHGLAVHQDMQTLREGGFIEKHVHQNVVFPRLKVDKDTLWSLLVFTGYLKAARPGPYLVGQPPPPYRLSIPNAEVATVFRTTFQSWLNDSLLSQEGNLETMLLKLLEGDAPRFEQQLKKFA